MPDVDDRPNGADTGHEGQRDDDGTSAVIAAWEAIDRLTNPREVTHLGLLFVAGIVGFAGNELVALYRIREGNAIGSAALVADGYHARTDGFTSLAVASPVTDRLRGWLVPAVDNGQGVSVHVVE